MVLKAVSVTQWRLPAARGGMSQATRTTGRARSFGFVEMPDAAEAQAAMEGLHGTVLGGRTLHVRAARQQKLILHPKLRGLIRSLTREKRR
jgi:RNA recognition motif-containing protein